MEKWAFDGIYNKLWNQIRKIVKQLYGPVTTWDKSSIKA